MMLHECLVKTPFSVVLKSSLPLQHLYYLFARHCSARQSLQHRCFTHLSSLCAHNWVQHFSNMSALQCHVICCSGWQDCSRSSTALDYPIPSSASFAGVKGGNVSSAGCQVALCVIPYGMWCNGVMTSQTAVSVLLAYFTVLAEGRSYSIVLYLNIMCPVAGCQCMVCMYLNQKLQVVKGEESMSASSGLLLYSAYFHSHSTRPN